MTDVKLFKMKMGMARVNSQGELKAGEIDFISNYTESSYLLKQERANRIVTLMGRLNGNLALRRFAFYDDLVSVDYCRLEAMEPQQYIMELKDEQQSIVLEGLKRVNYIEDKKNDTFTIEFSLCMDTHGLIKFE